MRPGILRRRWVLVSISCSIVIALIDLFLGLEIGVTAIRIFRNLQVVITTNNEAQLILSSKRKRYIERLIHAILFFYSVIRSINMEYFYIQISSF